VEPLDGARHAKFHMGWLHRAAGAGAERMYSSEARPRVKDWSILYENAAIRPP